MGMSAQGRFILIFLLLVCSVAGLVWLIHRRQPSTTSAPQTVRTEPSPQFSPLQNQSPAITPEPEPSPSPTVTAGPSPGEVAAAPSPPELQETASPPEAVPGFVGKLHLIIPVAGVSASQLRDTFDDARSEGRVHDAIDIPAASGTPVLAVADGEIVKLFQSDKGGTTIYQVSADKKLIYYYAHLQRYADGLAEGQSVRQGTVIAYVGDTGNAGTGNYHLHFSIAVVADPKRYWEGVNINPYPLLRGGQ
jgi:murein DD-endopeptidase MepM/ murein hydrolase activator NlpD